MPLERLAQHEAGLRQRALGRVDEQQHAVDHRQPALDLAAEVRVPGRVDDVELRVAVLDRGVLGEDRDALLALEVHRVHDAVVDVLVGAEGAGLPQHRVDQRRLAVVDVGDDRDVAQVVSALHGGNLDTVWRREVRWTGGRTTVRHRHEGGGAPADRLAPARPDPAAPSRARRPAAGRARAGRHDGREPLVAARGAAGADGARRVRDAPRDRHLRLVAGARPARAAAELRALAVRRRVRPAVRGAQGRRAGDRLARRAADRRRHAGPARLRWSRAPTR